MACAEDAFVPEAAAGNAGNYASYEGGQFGIDTFKGASHLGLLSRSGSRKRLCAEALTTGSDGSVPGDGALALEPADSEMMSALLLGYRSCPGVVSHPNTSRLPPSLRASIGARKAANKSVAAAITRQASVSYGARKSDPEAKAGLRDGSPPAPDSEILPQEVPVLGPPADVDVISVATAPTAVSALATSTTSRGLVKSAPLQPQLPSLGPLHTAGLYSALLLGPGFSYASNGDEVFGADAISLGSLTSGSYYMLGGDYDDDDDSEPDSVQFSPYGSRSIGTSVYSGSSKRPGDADNAVAAVAVAATMGPAPEDLTSLIHTCSGGRRPVSVAMSGGMLDGSLRVQGAVATVAAMTSQPGANTAVVAVTPNIGLLTCSPGIATHTSGIAINGGQVAHDALGSAGAAAAAAELEGEEDDKEEDSDYSPPVRSDSSESVGSAEGADCLGVPSVNSRAHEAAHASCVGIDAENVTAAVAAVWPPEASPALSSLPSGSVGWGSGGGSTAAAAAASTAAITTAFRQAAVPPPALLPPEVYLGFINQLVQSVRTAARVVDATYQSQHQNGIIGSDPDIDSGLHAHHVL